MSLVGSSVGTPSETKSPPDYDVDPLSISVTIRQDPLSVTLDGPAIFTLALALILEIHYCSPGLVISTISVVTAALFVHNDYQNYLKLGPGGTPATFPGYLRINWLKLWALRDPFVPLPADADMQPATGLLCRRGGQLPFRCGPRPRVVGIAPQRQVDQAGCGAAYASLRRVLTAHGRSHADEIGVGTSCFEKHGLGLFARFPVNHTCQGEICHVHASDHSLHLNLHPDDAREVLEKGWGQRHPLARTDSLLKMPVPRQFTMVYAPRSKDELKVVCQIIEAASWWVIAKEIPMDLLGEV
ncbi:hypothetical protein F4780DRAFT_207986 [Xylariomycetidae sp. FL0641]|nr:hypothetical protein F4780DRAFT_207986 [Xylariomycetidae sp. FL0641]